MDTLGQLRENRRHGMSAWLAGSTPDGAARWDGDDGRVLAMADIHQMRLDLAADAGTAEQQAAWQTIVAAQAARWDELDAVYEAAKAAL